MKRKILTVGIFTLLLIAIFPLSTAMAAEITEGGTFNIATCAQGEEVHIYTTESVVIIGTRNVSIIGKVAGINLTLNNANVSSNNCPLFFKGTGNTLTLTGTNTVSGGPISNAIHIESNGSLTINGSGSVTATGGAGDKNTSTMGGSGIGSGQTSPCTINIVSGTIDATGGYMCAGIGGRNACFATITIDGGSIGAQGGEGGAGIGGAYGTYGTVTINDGVIRYARGGNYGAGIGGGFSGGGTVTINDGTILEATGGTLGAGIGGGYKGRCTVTINGGVVKAEGGFHGPAIGGGKENTTGTVTIEGGEIYASGGSSTSDIGNGASGSGCVTKIGGDSVVFVRKGMVNTLYNYNHQYRTSGTIIVADGAATGSAYGYTKIPSSWGNGNSAYAYIPMAIKSGTPYKFTNVESELVLQASGAAGTDFTVAANANAKTQSFILQDMGDNKYWLASQDTAGLYMSTESPIQSGTKVELNDNTSSNNNFYFSQDDTGNVKIHCYSADYYVEVSGTTVGIYSNSVSNTQKWTMSVGEKYQVISGKMRVTYYRAAGTKERLDIYYGATTATKIQSRYLYDTTGLKTQMTAYNTAGKRTTMTKYHSNGKAKYKYFYNTTTNVKKSMMSYNTSGVQIAKTEYYANGASAKRQYLYYASGKKKIIKNFRTNKKLSSQTWFYTDGTSKKQFNTYDVNGKLTSISKYRQNGTRYYYKKY